jgi:hypothetical protein
MQKLGRHAKITTTAEVDSAFMKKGETTGTVRKIVTLIQTVLTIGNVYIHPAFLRKCLFA